MDFDFTEEQTLLRNMVQSFVQDNYDFDSRMKIVRSEIGMSRENWSQFAQLGLLAAPFSEALGGLGGGAVDTMIITEEFGKGLVTEPFIPTVVLCGGLLERHGSDAQKDTYLPSLIGGEKIWALAYSEPKSRFNPANVQAIVKQDGDGFVLNGLKSVVNGGPWADYLIVSARTSGEGWQQDGISLFIVDKSADGVASEDYETIDGGRAADISFENVILGAEALLGPLDAGLPLLEETLDYGIAAICGEAIGGMHQAHQATVEYCKTRNQFGVAIGSFQALQHRMVDMFMEYEQSVSLTYMVNMHVGGDAASRARAASGAKVQIGKAGRYIGQSAVHLHGGMGMSEELNVGHYFKRLTAIDAQLGSIDYHLKRFGSSEAA